MRHLSLLLAFALSCATATATARDASVAPAPVAAPRAAGPLAPDALAPPPAPDSVDGKSDLAILLWLQRTRTPEDVARARFHARVTLDRFAPALPPGFDPAGYPATQALVDRAQAFARRRSGAAKDHFRRPRPYAADPRVKPSVDLETSFAYPSGHAVRGIVTARVLAELAPDRRDPLLAIGLRIGYDRVVGGVHYPSDVLAGEQLGNAAVDALLADPEFRQQLEQVRRAEWSRPK